MNLLIQLESRINRLISRHEKGAVRAMRGACTLASLLVINGYFGYLPFFRSPLMIVGLTIFCAMIPLSASSLVIMGILLLELFALSTQVALVGLGLFLVAFFVTNFYGAKHLHNIVFLPLAYPLQIPYALPMISALTGGVQEVTGIICGGILSYYFLLVRRNSALLMEGGKAASLPGLLMSNMFSNNLFYFYMVALMLMFMVTYTVRERAVHQSWRLAAGSGIVTEFLVMMVGYLLTGNRGRILSLFIVNVILFALGVILSFFIKNLDYSRVENVSFEDDEYYYYVIAVPKIRLTEEEKHIKRITKEADRGEAEQ